MTGSTLSLPLKTTASSGQPRTYPSSLGIGLEWCVKRRRGRGRVQGRGGRKTDGGRGGGEGNASRGKRIWRMGASKLPATISSGICSLLEDVNFCIVIYLARKTGFLVYSMQYASQCIQCNMHPRFPVYSMQYASHCIHNMHPSVFNAICIPDSQCIQSNMHPSVFNAACFWYI